jgi:aryl-alcohol dehydrogenase-like predicted oxidoreductase
MRYNQLGRTGLLVSELCLGTMTFGGQGFWSAMGTLGQKDVDAIIGKSLDAGINFIDTADIYSEGVSEELTGQALANLKIRRESVVVATKFFGKMGAGPNDRGASRGHIMDAVKASLKRLKLDHIDLYQVHGTDPITPVEETVRALDDLVRQGLVRYVGCSNWPAWKIMKAVGVAQHHDRARFETVQAYYSIAGRDLEREIVPMLRSENVGLMVWSPLAGGLLSGKFKPDAKDPQGARRASFDFPPVNRERAWKCVDVMREVAKAHKASVAQVALSWLLHQEVVTSVILGVKTPEQLADDLGSVHVALTPEDLKRLDEVSALPKEYPGWMLERQNAEPRIPVFERGKKISSAA